MGYGAGPCVLVGRETGIGLGLADDHLTPIEEGAKVAKWGLTRTLIEVGRGFSALNLGLDLFAAWREFSACRDGM